MADDFEYVWAEDFYEPGRTYECHGELMKVKEAIDTLPESLLDEVDAAIAALPGSRPPGSFTRAEWQARHPGMTESTAQKQLHKLVAAGKARKIGGGHLVYYQLIK